MTMFPATTKGGGVNVTMGPLDTCKTPSPGGPVPVPYANMIDGLAAGGDEAAIRTKQKMVDAAAKQGYRTKSATSVAIAGFGDEAGVAGGLKSNVFMDKVTYKTGSSKVMAEGEKMTHMTAATGHNAANLPAGTQVAPSQSKVILME